MIIHGKLGTFVTSLGGSWVAGMALGPFIFIAERVSPTPEFINHERIHVRQQLELLFVGQWVLYGLFYLLGRAQGLDHMDAYYAIPFEVEAYNHQDDLEWLNNRPAWAWLYEPSPIWEL